MFYIKCTYAVSTFIGGGELLEHTSNMKGYTSEFGQLNDGWYKRENSSGRQTITVYRTSN